MPCYHRVLLTQILPPTISSAVLFNRRAEESQDSAQRYHEQPKHIGPSMRRTRQFEKMLDDWGCQSINYDDNPKRSFGCFADSDKRWPDLLVHAAQELSGVDWAEHVDHERQCAHKLQQPFALLAIPRRVRTLSVPWSCLREKAAAAVVRMCSLLPTSLTSAGWEQHPMERTSGKDGISEALGAASTFTSYTLLMVTC